MPAVGLQMLERSWLRPLVPVPQGDGTFQDETDAIGPDEVMVIDAIRLSSSPPTPVTWTFYFDDDLPEHFVTRSVNTPQDAWEGELEVPGGSSLVLVCSGVGGAPPVLKAKIHRTLYRVCALPTDRTLISWRGPR